MKTDRVFLDLPVTAPEGGLLDVLTLKAHTPHYCGDDGRQCVNGIILALDVGMFATTLMASRCRNCGTVLAWFNVAEPQQETITPAGQGGTEHDHQ